MLRHRSRRRALDRAIVTLFATVPTAALPVFAQDPDPSLSPVVVSATRQPRSSFDLPMSIDVIPGERLRDAQLGVNASETLVSIPGVIANNRQNYAQDLQISIRGFGSRSTFGVRGVRLYADGIPLTMPDGQGQAANLDLMTAQSIEVLRGPFSALYGNSSGGVISVFTEDGPQRPTITPYFAVGSYETTRSGLKFGGTAGNVNYLFNVSQFDSAGFRDWSAVRRDVANGKLSVRPDDYSKFTLVMIYLMQPETEDPQGLTAAQVEQNPRQVGVITGGIPGTSRTYGVRKSIDNAQVGGVYERQITSVDSIRALLYTGDRQVTQYLGLQPGAQNPVTSPGGVIDLDRQFMGVDLRWSRDDRVFERPLRFTVGLNYDRQEERRRGFNNFFGPSGNPTAIGVRGNLRRDENNIVFNFDQYVQAEYELAKQWVVSGGLRHSQVRFSSEDYFIVGANGNDSGALKFENTSPVAGVVYKATPLLNFYANAGRGFETPTFAELAYRPSGATGFNPLQANRTTNYEVGAKAYVGQDTRVNAALFHTKGDNEITVLTNTGGRSVFQNAGPSTRRGAELSIDSKLPMGIYALGAATWIDATFDSTFFACEQTLCPGTNAPQRVEAGSRIPGIPRVALYGELGWRGNGFGVAAEARSSSRVFVNDRNTEAAGAYELLNLRASYTHVFSSRVSVTGFGRIDNVLDQAYVGSVIVNDTNRRFYEPAPGRTYLAGVNATLSF
ncbi:MAG: TonB-dependent receptor [Burkholderiales bacterium]|nr:TonB-dependent receptor [Burkholderiales bacterium]